jgi:hypothetical protein
MKSFYGFAVESIQCNPHLFSDTGMGLTTLNPNYSRRLSDISIQSGMSGLTDALSLQTINECKRLIIVCMQIFWQQNPSSQLTPLLFI